MHEVKRQVKSDHKQPEVHLTQRFDIHPSSHLREPVVESAEKSEQDSAHDHVVEVRNHKIGIAELPIEGRRTQHDPSKTGNQKLKQKRNAEQHWRLEVNLSAPHGCQ